MTTWTAKVERDGAWWAITVPDLPGTYSQSRSLADARAMAVDAIAMMLDVEVDEITVELDVDLPDNASAALRAQHAATQNVVGAKQQAAAADAEAIGILRDLGLTVRDTAELVGLSYQRVSQIAAKAS